jgi:glycosyltransferase involved in cell wall biosynthesis
VARSGLGALRITVAICTYNPARVTLLRALDAIVGQLGEVSSAEVVVVDNNSSPPLTEHEYLSTYPIRLVHETQPGLTAAREAAIRNAKGDVIVFVDDDNILGKDYLATVVGEFSVDPRLGVLGGRILPEYGIEPPMWFGEFEQWLAVRRYAPELRVHTTAPPFSDYFPVGAGLAVRRDLALAYLDDCEETTRIEGRRGESLSSGEDLDLGLFALSQGNSLLVTGALCLTHVISTERLQGKYLRRLATDNVKSSLQLERKWAKRLGRPVYPMFSTPLTGLLARIVASAILSLRSPRYRIKFHRYVALMRLRLSGEL